MKITKELLEDIISASEDAMKAIATLRGALSNIDIQRTFADITEIEKVAEQGDTPDTKMKALYRRLWFQQWLIVNRVYPYHF